MKKKIAQLVGLAALSALLVGCCPPQTINANAVSQPLQDVSARHDAYINADESLSETEQSIFLRDTELLNMIVDEATSE